MRGQLFRYNFCSLHLFLQYEKVTTLFGEDHKKMSPDEFFGIFDQFLQSFNSCAGQNRRRQKKKEEEIKRQKIESQVCISVEDRFYFQQMR